MSTQIGVPVMIQDPLLPARDKTDHQRIDASLFACFLDGPVTDRVAVLDFDPKTGMVRQGARFERAGDGAKAGRYVVADEKQYDAADFCQCNVFGVVAETIAMFEEADVLGRRLAWAFDEPQLLVVPRAGEWANAFYQRGTHSLQFFFFPSARTPGRTVYTCLSRDIVAHETGHAVLDGICPELYNAITPQSLALHEAVADLTALVVTFRSNKLCDIVLRQTKGSIKDSAAFSAFAEEFGHERGLFGPAYLRNLNNDTILDETVARSDPHVLCDVLTGAVYKVALKIYSKLRRREVAKAGRATIGAWKKALYLTHERLSRMLFRALDYLPPGEVSFGDYGRAILAADRATHRKWSPEREWLVDEFVRRGIVPRRGDLAVRTNRMVPVETDFTLDQLVDSDWAAYTFGDTHRRLLHIPKDALFEVHPRLDVTKAYYTGGAEPTGVRECLFKVSWQHLERNRVGAGYPRRRRFTVGTTLAIDWEKTQRAHSKGQKALFVRAILTTKPTPESAKERDELLSRMIERGLLQLEDEIETLDGKRPSWVIPADCAENRLRVRGTLKVLHLLGEL